MADSRDAAAGPGLTPGVLQEGIGGREALVVERAVRAEHHVHDAVRGGDHRRQRLAAEPVRRGKYLTFPLDFFQIISFLLWSRASYEFKKHPNVFKPEQTTGNYEVLVKTFVRVTNFFSS